MNSIQETNKEIYLIAEIGCDLKTIKMVKELFGVPILNLPQDPEQIMSLQFEPPALILTGELLPKERRQELLQIVGLQFSGKPVYDVACNIKKFNELTSLNEGLAETFLLPFELSDFEEALNQVLGNHGAVKKKFYEKVRLSDIDPSEALPFDLNVFLRANRKFICVVRKGRAPGKANLAKLRAKTATVYIDREETAKFHQYVRDQISKRQLHENLGATQKKTNFYNSVKKLVRCLIQEFSQRSVHEDEVLQLIANCREGLRDYLRHTTYQNWKDRLLEVYGDRLDYSYMHATNTALYAVFLSMGTNIGDPEEIGIAGILHDIGLVTIETDIQAKAYDELPEQARTEYETHVQRAVNLIRSRCPKISKVILDCISQHHEQSDGDGYPAKLQDNKISNQSQILSIADKLDDLMSFTDLREAMSPLEAITKIVESNSRQKGQFYNRELLTQIQSMFVEQFSPSDEVDKKAG